MNKIISSQKELIDIDKVVIDPYQNLRDKVINKLCMFLLFLDMHYKHDNLIEIYRILDSAKKNADISNEAIFNCKYSKYDISEIEDSIMEGIKYLLLLHLHYSKNDTASIYDLLQYAKKISIKIDKNLINYRIKLKDE